MDKLSLKNKDWKDFYLSDFFDFEKGNQNLFAKNLSYNVTYKSIFAYSSTAY